MAEMARTSPFPQRPTFATDGFVARHGHREGTARAPPTRPCGRPLGPLPTGPHTELLNVGHPTADVVEPDQTDCLSEGQRVNRRSSLRDFFLLARTSFRAGAAALRIARWRSRFLGRMRPRPRR